jgi:hypothetical protein
MGLNLCGSVFVAYLTKKVDSILAKKREHFEEWYLPGCYAMWLL